MLSTETCLRPSCPRNQSCACLFREEEDKQPDPCIGAESEGILADFLDIASFGPSLDEFEIDMSRHGEENQQ